RSTTSSTSPSGSSHVTTNWPSPRTWTSRPRSARWASISPRRAGSAVKVQRITSIEAAACGALIGLLRGSGGLWSNIVGTFRVGTVIGREDGRLDPGKPAGILNERTLGRPATARPDSPATAPGSPPVAPDPVVRTQVNSDGPAAGPARYPD